MSGSDFEDTVLGATRVHEAPLRIGAEFAGRYRIDRELGRGGMGAVYAAFDHELEETIALKMLQASTEVSDSALERFRREVRLARKVTHSNVARTYDIGEADGVHYLTMEFITGASLSSVLRSEGPLESARAIGIAVQVCEALVAAHAAGVVHRDLKPANVMLETGGRVVVTDFGIARSMLEESGVTQEGAQIIGTPTYMAPEQVTGGAVTPRTDLYSLGIIMFEMVTGKRPFARDTAVGTAMARLNDPPPRPSEFIEIPDDLERAILRCLSLDPEDRPATAAEVIALLRSPSHFEVPPTASSSFVSARLRGPGVAILPFVYRGPPDESYVAEALTDDLIDLLSMTKGLRVPAAGATARFAQQRDPAVVGRELSVDAVVDGTVQRFGSRIRVSARLIDGATGIQTWSERVDGELDDVFELQDRLARRIAESLRMRLHTEAFHGRLPPTAVDLYFRARAKARMFDMGDDGPNEAVALFEQCLVLAPNFAPALTGYAIACARMWFSQPEGSVEDWPNRCRKAVARALEMAPDLPEAHIAAARMHMQEVQLPLAAKALARALELAPTCAPAHALLGSLQLEGGRPDEGARHLELAAELDPSQRQTMVLVGKWAALHGQWDKADRLLELVEREMPYMRRTLTVVQMRASAWRGDLEALARFREAYSRREFLESATLWLLASAYLGEVGPAEVAENLSVAFPGDASPRLRALVHQLACEGLASNNHLNAAMMHLQCSLDLGLVDLDWLEHCPCLASLRDRPEFAPIEDEVRRRVQAIWSAS